MVRTRFAPSPTGYMHIGNLRTALYAFLFARKNKGAFVLRIEDTDQARYIPESVAVILQSLKLAGLEYDEGPDTGGKFAPYVQSERKEIYQKMAAKLLAQGGAYHCFCTADRLKQLHEDQAAAKQPQKYDGHCRSLSATETEKLLAAKTPFVIRQKIPENARTTFTDEIFGEISVDNKELDDTVLIKSDGFPTYNFAHVVDDHLMEITHVIRGTEFLSSTPKYVLLYQSFGWTVPTYMHLPPIMKTATKKLSKREGDASFEDFIQKGFLVPAIINYIALLGWNPKTDRELFTLTELIDAFDSSGLQKAPAIFDERKLRWFNAQYLQKMSRDEFTARAEPYYERALGTTKLDRDKISEMLQVRLETLNEIPEAINFLAKLPSYDRGLFVNKKMKTDLAIAAQALQLSREFLSTTKKWIGDDLKAGLGELAAKHGLSNGQLLWPLRIALSGKEFTPGGAIEIMLVLGPEETLQRLAVGQKILA